MKRKFALSLSLLALAAASVALAYTHPYDCIFADGPDMYVPGAPSITMTGPNAAATVAGGSGAPDANASCMNFNTPPPSVATATASRKDTDNHQTSGVGIWVINYDVQDAFWQQVNGATQPGATNSSSATSRGWIKDIPSGATLWSLLTGNWNNGTGGGNSVTMNLTITGCVVTLSFGDGAMLTIEAETLSVAGATSNDQGQGVANCHSSPQPIVVVVTGWVDVG